MSEYYLEDIQFDINTSKKKNRSKSILDELDELDSNESPLLSSLLSNKPEEKKEEKKKEVKIDTPFPSNDNENTGNDEELDSDWMAALTSFKAPKAKKKKKSLFSGFDEGKKGKKKKKDKKGQSVSHKKDFDPEMAILRNLQMDQSKFVDSLQKKYDQMEGTKSSSRGVSKYTTDLINSITTARSVSMQLVDKIISTKKTIADLDFKERKEFGSNSGSEQANLTNYASTYLKQVMSVGRNNVINQSSMYEPDNYVDEANDDDLFSSIDESLGDTNRSEDVEKYLKYENDDVKIKVIWYDDRNDDDLEKKYDYIAYNKNGENVPDYPLPEKTKLNINRSTGMCTDIYGNSYELVII
jgi:hypothetical protein